MEEIDITIINAISGNIILNFHINKNIYISDIRKIIDNKLNNNIQYKLLLNNDIISSLVTIKYIINKYLLKNKIILNLVISNNNKHLWLHYNNTLILDIFESPKIIHKTIDSIIISDNLIFTYRNYDIATIQTLDNHYNNDLLSPILFSLEDIAIVNIKTIDVNDFIISYSDGEIIRYIIEENNNEYKINKLELINKAYQNCSNYHSILIDITNNKNILAYTTYDNKLIFYDLVNNIILYEDKINMKDLVSIKFSPLDTYLLLIIKNKMCIIYDIINYKIIKTIKCKISDADWVNSNTIVTIQNNNIIFYNIITNQIIKIIHDNNNDILHLVKYIEGYIYTTSSCKMNINNKNIGILKYWDLPIFKNNIQYTEYKEYKPLYENIYDDIILNINYT
jgi:hypothetical protein